MSLLVSHLQIIIHLLSDYLFLIYFPVSLLEDMYDICLFPFPWSLTFLQWHLEHFKWLVKCNSTLFCMDQELKWVEALCILFISLIIISMFLKTSSLLKITDVGATVPSIVNLYNYLFVLCREKSVTLTGPHLLNFPYYHTTFYTCVCCPYS